MCSLYSGEGVDPHYPGVRGLGPQLARPPGGLPLQQPGGGLLSPLTYKQAQGDHALGSLLGVCGGHSGVLFGSRVHQY